jgi:hypothetical protein
LTDFQDSCPTGEFYQQVDKNIASVCTTLQAANSVPHFRQGDSTVHTFTFHQTRKFLSGSLLSLIILLGSILAQTPSAKSAQQPLADPKKGEADGPVIVSSGDVNRDPERPEPKKIEPYQFGVFGFPSINNKGEVAFLGRYPTKTAGVVGQGIFVKSDKGIRVVASSEVKIPVLDEYFISFNNPVIADNGDVTFVASFTGKKTDVVPGAPPSPETGNPDDSRRAAIWLADASGLRMVARINDEVPRMPSRMQSLSSPSINSNGLLAFVGTYVDPDGRGLFFYDLKADQGKGKMNLVARSGQKTPAGPETSYSEHFYPAYLNNRGEIAFFVRVGDGGGVFVKRDSGIELIALQGRPSIMKNGDAQANWLGFGNMSPDINDNGTIVFVAFWDGQNFGRGIFVKEPGDSAIKNVLRTGDKVGETEAIFSDFSNPIINTRGEIAFKASYGGRSRGIFVKTAKGIEIVAREGDKLPGGGRDEIFNNFAQLSFNDHGQLVFYGMLKGATVGLFIWDEKEGLRRLVGRGDPVPNRPETGPSK